MPAIKIFSRRTFLGGDDLQPAAIAGIIIRSLQILLFILPLLVQTFVLAAQKTLQSKDGSVTAAALVVDYLFAYGVASFLYCLLNIILAINVYTISSQGTPTTEVMQRSSKVSKILRFQLTGVFLALIVIFSFGVMTAFMTRSYYLNVITPDSNRTSTSDNSSSTLHHNAFVYDRQQQSSVTYASDGQQSLTASSIIPGNVTTGEVPLLESKFSPSWWIALTLLLANQAIEILVRIFGWCLFLRLPKSMERSASHTNSSHGAIVNMLHHHAHYGAIEELWRARCRTCCKISGVATCYLFGGREIDGGEFNQIARILTDYFEDGGQLDVVPSDIVMGFMLLWRLQKQRQVASRRELLAKASISESKSSSELVPTCSYDSIEEEPETTLVVRQRQRQYLNPSVLHNELSPTESTNSNEEQLREVTLIQPKINHCSPIYDDSLRNFLSPDDESDRLTMAEGARFGRHALAIYTWKLFIYMKPIKGTCYLAWPRQLFSAFTTAVSTDDKSESYQACCNSINKLSFRCVEGDNCLQLNETSLIAQAGLEETSDLVYARFDNGLVETPHCIIIDRKWKSIVLSIRGSLSLEDCLIDVLCDPESLEKLGNDYGFAGEGEYCHSGVVSRVEWLHDNLERNGVLDKLLLDPASEFRDYRLRLVGHSLGAGCAVILGFMLKQKFPNLRCLLYSPPGGLLTWNSATGCKDFVTSFVLDNEFVPRLSVENMEQLRDEVLELILRAKVPKIVVAHDFVAKAAVAMVAPNSSDCEGLFDDDSNMLHPKGVAPMDSLFAQQLLHFKQIQQQRREHRGRIPSALFPPGKIVHLVKTSEVQSWSNTCWKFATCCTSNAGFRYTPKWANNDDFNEIIISSTMGTDHFPDRLCAEIDKTASNFGVEEVSGDHFEEFHRNNFT